MPCHKQPQDSRARVTMDDVMAALNRSVGEEVTQNALSINSALRSGNLEALRDHFNHLVDHAVVSREGAVCAMEMVLDMNKTAHRDIAFDIATKIIDRASSDVGKDTNTASLSASDTSVIIRATAITANVLALRIEAEEAVRDEDIRTVRSRINQLRDPAIAPLDSTTLDEAFSRITRAEATRIFRQGGIREALDYIDTAVRERPNLSHGFAVLMFDLASELVPERPEEAVGIFRRAVEMAGSSVLIGQRALEFADLCGERERTAFLNQIGDINTSCAGLIVSALRGNATEAILDPPRALAYLRDAVEVAHHAGRDVRTMCIIVDEMCALVNVCHSKDNCSAIADQLASLRKGVHGWLGDLEQECRALLAKIDSARSVLSSCYRAKHEKEADRLLKEARELQAMSSYRDEPREAEGETRALLRALGKLTTVAILSAPGSEEIAIEGKIESALDLLVSFMHRHVECKLKWRLFRKRDVRGAATFVEGVMKNEAVKKACEILGEPQDTTPGDVKFAGREGVADIARRVRLVRA